ncbi:MAG: ATP-dependent DNA ligase [Candidatus Heimdallarchaeota archaeon]|nr:ATP-dependent DNA ligase [Candidatus Heimdallarchaeota archaeon]MCK5048428.1 ATP-dependent DNA ligase [Candidatus Heimdallarchaeota archaeon]
MNINFDELAAFYERLEATPGRLEMIDILAELFGKIDTSEIEMVCYLTLGKLGDGPSELTLGLAEKLVIQTLAEQYGMSESEVEKLLAEHGDLGVVAEQTISKKTQSTLFDFFEDDESSPSSFSITSLWSLLLKLAHTTGTGSTGTKQSLLTNLLIDSSPLESRYIVRIVLGKLRLGVREMTLLEALALHYTGDRKNKSLLERAYNFISDIGKVASILVNDGFEAIQKITPSPGTPIRCMAAQRADSASEILNKLGGKAALEIKYDGLRIQAHITPSGVILYSRNHEDLTPQFPDIVSSLQKASQVSNAIVEGEILAYDFENDTFLPFQNLMRRRRKTEIDEMMKKFPAKIYLFDALLIDDLSVVDLSLPDRRKLLENSFHENESLAFSELLYISSEDELNDFFMQAVKAGCEGIMAKSITPSSIYEAGVRGWNWIKYKADYVGSLTDTFDLTIIGAYSGKGKRTGTIGALLCASYNEDEDVYQSFCKLGTGFSDEDLKELTDILEPLKVKEKPNNVMSGIDPDNWVRPKIVVEVAAAEISKSPTHMTAWNGTSGLALRFPRFTGRIRTDKSADQSTSLSEILLMYEAKRRAV